MTIPHERAEKAPPEKPNSQGAQPKQKSRLAQLSLVTLGVVFGDISTSPIYAIRECFHGEFGIDVTLSNVLGILSLMFWPLAKIVDLKYLTFVYRTNNHGKVVNLR
jgi:KUP system potassium uptake protein